MCSQKFTLRSIQLGGDNHWSPHFLNLHLWLADEVNTWWWGGRVSRGAPATRAAASTAEVAPLAPPTSPSAAPQVAPLPPTATQVTNLILQSLPTENGLKLAELGLKLAKLKVDL